MASFVAALDTPTLADERCFDSRDLMDIIGLKAAYAISIKAGISLGCEFYMPHHVLTEDVLEERVANQNDHVVVPDGPGLGINVSDWSVRTSARVLAEK
jgi:muconate cycloisomerase